MDTELTDADVVINRNDEYDNRNDHLGERNDAHPMPIRSAFEPHSISAKNGASGNPTNKLGKKSGKPARKTVKRA